MENEIYKFLKENNLTQKDEKSFLEEYSKPEKAKELHGFMVENQLTSKTDAEFYDQYFKKKDTAQSGESTQPLQQPIEPSATPTKAVKGVGTTTEFGESAIKLEDVEITPKEETPTFTESVKGSYDNFINQLKSFVPNTQIAAASVWEGVLGKELANKWYNLEGRDIDEVRSNAYAKLDELQKEYQPTRGLIESAKDLDAAGFSAALIDAVSAIGSTAITSGATLGGGLITDMVGRSIADYNTEKAKTKGKSVDDLYKEGEADVMFPTIVGLVGAGLEGVGLKGTQQAIISKITPLAAKQFAKFGWEANKEGLTEYTQTILEEVNKGVAQGKSGEEVAQIALNAAMSEQAAEAYLKGVAGSAGVAIGTKVAKGGYKSLTKEESQNLNEAIKTDKGVSIASAVNKAVNSGVMDAAQGMEIVSALKPRIETVNNLPADIADNPQSVEAVTEIKQLESKKQGLNEIEAAFVDAQINDLQKTVAIPLPPKFNDTAGQNTSELKDGQLYITKDGSVKSWDANNEKFLDKSPLTSKSQKPKANVSEVLNQIYELEQSKRFENEEGKKKIDDEIERLKASIRGSSEEGGKVETQDKIENKVAEPEQKTLDAENKSDKVAEKTLESTTQPTSEVSPSSIDNGEAAVVETPTQTEVVAEEVAQPTEVVTQQPSTETVQTETEVAPKSDALKDVESTAKALEGVVGEDVKPETNKTITELRDRLKKAELERTNLLISGNKSISVDEKMKNEIFSLKKEIAKEENKIAEIRKANLQTMIDNGQLKNAIDNNLITAEDARLQAIGNGIKVPTWLQSLVDGNKAKKEAATESILGRTTDFLGKEKEEFMIPKTDDSVRDKETADYLKGHVKRAIDNGKYEKSISDGRMTAQDAKTIIESYGLKTPKAVEELLGKKAEPITVEETQTETVAKEPAPTESVAPQPTAELTPLQLAKQKLQEAREKAKAIRDAKSNLSAVSDPFGDAKKQAEADREVFDAYVSLGKEYIKAGIKSVEEFAKEIGEELSDAIKKAWDAANENVKSETENFEKWKAYAKKQFEAEDGGLEFQDFKARFNKKFNVAADDVALVEVFSEAQSEYNAERGVTTSRKEVDKSFKDKPKMITIDEAKARTQQIRLEVKAAKDGAKSVTEAVKAIVKYVNEMSDRGNLTRADLAKIMNLIPNVKDQKTLDTTADKIYNIIEKADSDVIEVSERKALKDQIRLEAKAAKEGFREARKQQQSFANRIKAFLDSVEVKGKLSPAQVKSLINRASNIKTERGLDNFIEYAEKVIDNVNYDAEMNEIRRQQKVAKSRKHTSMQKAVNEFLAINPEIIPESLMPEYQKALDELSGRVPSYKTFQDIYHQVMALNTPKDNFSNVKTYNDALDLYNSIAINKVYSIEEYRQLFKDINAFKRKVDALFENGDITEQEHTDLLEQVGKDQKTVEDKYASEIYSLKTDLILEMKNMFNSVSLQNMTEEGKDLLRRLNKLNNNDLRNLSPEEIYNLTSILDNIRETGYVDAFRLNSIIVKSNGVLGGKEVGGQIQNAKPFSSLKSSVKEISDKLSEAYSSFWEDKLGLGSREAGAYYNNIVSPMERAVSSYREAVQNGYKKINELKKKHSIKQDSMDRIGLFASYLREYGLGQDVDTKGKKDSKGDLFGTRDWFKTILEQQKETHTLSKNDIDAIRKAWESLPKTNGKVDIEALEKSYRDGTNQFLTKNEMEFLKEMMAWKDENLTGKQQAANEFRGKGFNPLLYHIKRIRKDGKQKDVTSPIEITEQGNVRIAAGSGKEVQTNEVGAIEHNFEKIFSNNLEETMRDYYMTPMLQQASQVLSNAEKTAGKRNGYVEVMRKNLADAVNNEFTAEETNKISRFFSQSLLKARAAQVLIAPLRTVGELVSSLVSYPMRTREMGSYLELFRKKDVAQKLLNATGSPFKDKANINKHFDVQDGSLKEQGKFDLATGYFAAMPERAGLLPVWMASFDSAFKKKTGVNFDRDAYMNDPAYEKKYQRDIDNSASQADALYGEIAGSPTKAGQRREVRFAPSVSAFGKSFGLGNTVSANSPVGKVVAFMTGYPFREVEGMLKAVSAMKESVKDADASKVDVAAQALPIVGSILGAATYGLFQSLNYELGNLLLGDDEEKKKAKDNIETLTSPMGLLKETLAGTTSLLASKYSGAGRQMIKWMGSLAYNMTDDEKDKVAIRSMIRNVTFQDPYEIKFTKNGKVNKFMQKEKIAKEITDGIAPLTVFVDNTTKAVESIGGYQYLFDKIEKGKLLSEPEKEALVLTYITFNALNMAGMAWGVGIPVTTLNKLAKKAIKEKEDANKNSASDFLPSGGGSAKDFLPRGK